MCILFVYVDPKPQQNGYRLIVASNRDEYYKRPAKNAHHCPKSGVIGGRDMEPGREGGMWLGLKADQSTSTLKFAALLNITGEKLPQASGRGVLVNDYLENDIGAEKYLRQLKDETKTFNGYNFVAAELSKDEGNVYLHSNTPVITASFSGRQYLGFGNSPVNAPLTKVCKGRRLFQDIVETNANKKELIQQLINLLKSEVSCLPDDELERRAPIAYKYLSSNFVKIDDQYGTRAHTIILVDYNWNVEFVEQALEQPIDANNPKWIESTIKSSL